MVAVLRRAVSLSAIAFFAIAMIGCGSKDEANAPVANPPGTGVTAAKDPSLQTGKGADFSSKTVKMSPNPTATPVQPGSKGGSGAGSGGN